MNKGLANMMISP